ncbi:substrate-binding domain-containing protein [Desulfosporosinus sp. OT]|uniref:substrate-binding domain-containing protein n=1 Tax=Desulfosporosinus sp. OT TaxID=913865 RepID=UPI0002239F3D|nr:substrate-binding domain-containing protein [Desulfosporosinus sp. OT]EGW35965.1 periplasmic binding s and sugar binding domain of the LacI family protein [Desulfosporosinus sp. OT]
MRKLRGLLALTMVSVLIGVAGCGAAKTAETNAPKDAPKQVVIGFSQVTLDSPFYVSLMDAAKAEAEAKGAKLVYVDAQNNIEKQNKDIQDLITKGINVLILNPSNPTAVAPSLAAAKQANIPVVTVDRPTDGKVATFVGRDNKKMGELAGKEAVLLLGGEGKAKGKIIELQGDAGGKVMMDRRDGFHLAVDKEPGIKVIQGPYCDYTRSKAVKAFQDLLQANPDVNLVYAHNDDMSLGALQVLEQNQLAGKVKIVGVDGLMEAIKAIPTGKYDATVLNDPQLLGKTVVDTALGVLDGKTYDAFIDAGTTLINKDNAAQYINDKLTFAASK